MASTAMTDPTLRGVTLNLQRGPPSASSYAGSEASEETTTASFASNSTIGDAYFRENPQYYSTPMVAQVHRDASNTLPSNPSTNTPLPLLQIYEGDTLIFINPPPSTVTPQIASLRMGHSSAPMRVVSDILLSTGSQVFGQLFGPAMQKRHLNRLVKQKKIFLNGGVLPYGIKYVLDLTPEDEGEKAVEWQEKLWCPDVVLQWKSDLDPFDAAPTISAQEQIAKNLEDFRQKEWGEQKQPAEGEESSQTQRPLVPPPKPKTELQEPYSFGRHVLGLERLIHIIHGSDPLVKSTVDWYTLHCLSVAFGTTDATRDYIARWIFSNPLMIETHPSFILKIAVEAGLANIASDAFAAAVMRATFDGEEALKIPGAPEAASSLTARAEKELKDLLSMDWIDQYLPPTTDEDKLGFDVFRVSLRSYISRRIKICGGLELVDVSVGEVERRAMSRNTWVRVQTTTLASEMKNYAPPNLDALARFDIEKAILHWKQWEAFGGEGTGVDDLWRDVKLGAPHHPIPSVTQQTSAQGTDTEIEKVTYEDATSEIASQSGTEVPGIDDDVQSISSTHTINLGMNALKADEKTSVFAESSATLIEPISSVEQVPIKPQDESQQEHLPPASALFEIVDNQPKSPSNPEVQEVYENPYQPTYLPTALNPTTDIEPALPSSDPETPLWLQEQLAVLSKEHSPAHFWAVMHHPSHDLSRSAEPRIRCFDCPDMLYFPGPEYSLSNFLVHTRNIKHHSRVANRLANPKPAKSDDDKPAVNDSYYQNLWKSSSSGKSHIEIPFSLLNIIRLCETYVKSKSAEMTARNIMFEPILLEEQLACLEESERSFMPVWSGGEAIGSTRGTQRRGISDQSANDDMSVNVSSVGVGSVCTASTFSTTDSYVDIETPSASSSGSVISMSGDEDDAVMSAPGEEDDWVMSDGDDEDYEIDDDAYFG